MPKSKLIHASERDQQCKFCSSYVKRIFQSHKLVHTQVSEMAWLKCPGPCLSTATWHCRKNSSQRQRSFQWKLRSNWRQCLRQRLATVVRQGPGSPLSLASRSILKYLIMGLDPWVCEQVGVWVVMVGGWGGGVFNLAMSRYRNRYSYLAH